MVDLYDYPLPELAELLTMWGFSSTHAVAIWRQLYRKGVASVEQLDQLPPRLKHRLVGEARLATAEAVRAADDALAQKFLLQVAASSAPQRRAAEIETVLMPQTGRVTVCLSTQAGCALGCTFCATGQMGFVRNLTASEIVAQALFVERWLRGHSQEAMPSRIRNVVLMGMGEPLQNYDAVMRALDILRHPAGLAVAHKRITLSTVGIVPGIVRMADERRPYSLAVSLHAADQQQRAAMLPIAKTYPLDELMQACRYYCQTLDRRIFFEWTLIAGENDSLGHASQLASLVASLPAHVNLIPLNRTLAFNGAAAAREAMDAFQSLLMARGIPCTVRQRRGIDIDAGCGQLAAAGRSVTKAAITGRGVAE